MKRNFVFAAMLSLFVLAIAVSAQDKAAKAANFSGTWTLDVSKSKLGDRNSIESQTLTVVQTDKDIKFTPATKRKAPPAGAPAGGPPGGGGGGRMGGGDTTSSYTLDGKETTVEIDSQMGKVPVKYTGKWDGGKLVLSSSRTMTTPNGEMTSTTKETWEMGADGKSFTVNRESVRNGNATSTTMVYTKS